jgi:hypothetical protein
MGFIARFTWAYVRLLAMTAAWMTAAVGSLGARTPAKPEADVVVSGSRRDPVLEPAVQPPAVRGQQGSAAEVMSPARPRASSPPAPAPPLGTAPGWPPHRPAAPPGRLRPAISPTGSRIPTSNFAPTASIGSLTGTAGGARSDRQPGWSIVSPCRWSERVESTVEAWTNHSHRDEVSRWAN